MKRIMLAAAFALAVGGQALAADLPQPAPPPPRAPATYVPAAIPYYNWGGIYIGINGGYGFGRSDWTAVGGTTGTFNTSGFLGGGTVGANFQAAAFVFGVEGDIDWTNLSGNASAANCPPGCTTSSNYLGTGRVRAGYAFDRILIYATGGGAVGNVKAAVGGGFGSNSNTEFGWTAGLGVEAAFAPNWTAKVEYLYVDLANGTCTTACIAAGFGTANVTFTESLIRAGVNYKFSF
jgi:outer membrane immunogenic protein